MKIISQKELIIGSHSGGKDSTANTILAHIHGEPLDRLVTAEVMFDLDNGISAENKEHMDFIKKVQVPMFESWGYRVDIVHSDVDFLDCFYHVVDKPRKCMDHLGKHKGFPMAGTCVVKRDCKIKPINNYLKNLQKQGYDIKQYIGIAVDEPSRLESLHKDQNHSSLLEKYGLTEDDAKELCREYGLLSPIYDLGEKGMKRQGCWCCPNAKDCEHIAVMQNDPKAWVKYVALEDVENKIYNRWNVHTTETLHERDARLRSLIN